MYKLKGQDMTKEQLEAYAEEEMIAIDWDSIDEEPTETIALVKAEIVNPENSQKLLDIIICAEDEEYEGAKVQLTLTSRYHDWHNTVADKLAENIQTYQEETEKLEEGEELPYYAQIKDELIEEYNKLIAIINQYGDMSPIKREDIEAGNVDADSIGFPL